MNPRTFLYAAVSLVLLALVGSFVLSKNKAPSTMSETPRTIHGTLAIENVLPATEIAVPSGASALELLAEVSSAMPFVLETKEYAGLGTLVERIGDHKNDSARHWHYYVNGALAPVGAGAYIVEEGDAVEWRFRTPDEAL